MGRGKSEKMKAQQRTFIKILRETGKVLDYREIHHRLKENHDYRNLPTPHQLALWAKKENKIKSEKRKITIHGRTAERNTYRWEDI